MKMRTILSIALCIGFLFAANSLAGFNNKHVLPAQNQYNYSSPFRYVIVNNEVIDDSGDPKDAYRYVEVLLDEKAFSEATLKKLFKLLSKRFPKPSTMDVSVSTNLEQVDTPEERDEPKVSEAPATPSLNRYPSALLIRIDGNELFRYTPNPPNTEMKTVILRGRDPQAPPR